MNPNVNIFVIVLLSLFMLYCLIQLFRNKLVYEARKRTLEDIGKAKGRDKQTAMLIKFRHSLLSYNEMMSISNFFVPVSRLENELRKDVGLSK